MCDFCEKRKPLLKKTGIISDNIVIWGGEVDLSDTYDMHLFIDRSFIRLADPTDCQCLDHGAKIKINFCPMCGREIMKNEIPERFKKV